LLGLNPSEGHRVNRLWIRVGVRVASVGVLVAGVAGGAYLGQTRDDAAGSPADAALADSDDLWLLKRLQNEHAAARAWQRQAEGDAAQKAATEARAAAGKARRLEQRVISERKAAEARKKAESGGPVPYDGPIPGSCKEFSGSRAIGCTLMLKAGFGIDQFPCLNKLWDHESGWNYKATNRSSGAYGIPQAYPGSKMSSAGADWKTNPATQIKWGLGYIKGRYDTPCGAWSHFQNNGSY
jgi:hypothetical protein